jgi:transcriptional regulator with XRE-family HTH domain
MFCSDHSSTSPIFSEGMTMSRKRNIGQHHDDAIARMLRTRQVELRLTTTDLAKESGISRTHLINTLKGERLPRGDTYRRLYQALKIDDLEAIGAYLEKMSADEDWPELAEFTKSCIAGTRSPRDSLTLELGELRGAVRGEAKQMLRALTEHFVRILTHSKSNESTQSLSHIDTSDDKFAPYKGCKHLYFRSIGFSRQGDGYIAGVFRIKGRSAVIDKHCKDVYSSNSQELYMVIRGSGTLFLERDASNAAHSKKLARSKYRFRRHDVSVGIGGEYPGEQCHFWVNPFDEPLDVMLTVIPFVVPKRLSDKELAKFFPWCIHPYSFSLDEFENAPIPDELKERLPEVVQNA